MTVSWHEQDWHLREKGQYIKGQNVMRNGINGTGLVFKILLITIHARQKGTVDFIPNELFGIYCSLLVITIPTLKMRSYNYISFLAQVTI
jgi:hypothetical protein